MVNTSISLLAVVLSYVFQVMRLPAHSWRIASIRLATHQTVYQLQQACRAEVQAFRNALNAIVALENEAAAGDVQLATSKRLVLERLRVAQSALRASLNEGLR